MKKHATHIAGGRTPSSWSTTTITLTVHPWHGERVAVLRRYGANAVVIEREGNEQRIIPIRWTGLQPYVEVAEVDGRTVFLTPETARQLCAWVAARQEEGSPC